MVPLHVLRTSFFP